MIYKGITKERKPVITISIALVAAYMLYLEIRAEQWIYVPIAILVILACFFRKEQLISKEGVDIKYFLFNVPMHNYWRWEEITTLHTDRKKAAPNVMLHIGKDIVTRTFVMKPIDCEGALNLAAEMNPKIYIEDLSEKEQEKREQEILHRQEVARAQKVARKKRK